MNTIPLRSALAALRIAAKPMRTPGKYVASGFIDPLDEAPQSNVNNNGSGHHLDDPCFAK